MRNVKRGLTLLESMVTFLLLMICLAMIASLFREYSGLLRFGSQLNPRLEAAQVAVARIRVELAESLTVVSPTTGSAGSLRLLRTDPTAARLPQPPFPAPLTFDPYQPISRVEILYYLDTGQLKREAPSGSGDEVILAREIQGFLVERLANGNIKIELQVRTGSSASTLGAEVFRPMEVALP